MTHFKYKIFHKYFLWFLVKFHGKIDPQIHSWHFWESFLIIFDLLKMVKTNSSIDSEKFSVLKSHVLEFYSLMISMIFHTEYTWVWWIFLSTRSWSFFKQKVHFQTFVYSSKLIQSNWYISGETSIWLQNQKFYWKSWR